MSLLATRMKSRNHWCNDSRYYFPMHAGLRLFIKIIFWSVFAVLVVQNQLIVQNLFGLAMDLLAKAFGALSTMLSYAAASGARPV